MVPLGRYSGAKAFTGLHIYGEPVFAHMLSMCIVMAFRAKRAVEFDF
jgi:hypothetical protein